MGNIFPVLRRNQRFTSRDVSVGAGRYSDVSGPTRGGRGVGRAGLGNISRNRSISRQPSTSVTVSGSGPSNQDQKKKKKSNNIKNKFSLILDNFNTLEEVRTLVLFLQFYQIISVSCI